MNNLIYVASLIINKIPIIFLPIYYLSFLFPRDNNIWVFGSSFGNSFTGNPKYQFIYSSSIKDVRCIWISRNQNIVNMLNEKNYEAYNLYSFKGIYFALRAKKYIFDHYSKDISFWLSGGSIKMNLWHGIPLNKGHRDNRFDIVRNPRNIWDIIRWTFRRIQNEKPSHYYSVTSEANKNIWIRAFKAESSRIFIYGYSRNDIFRNDEFFIKNKNIIVDDLKKFEEIRKSKNKLIVYMPTHRKSEDKIFNIINFDEFNLFLKENNMLFLLKLHQFSSVKKMFKNKNYSNIEIIDYKLDAYPYLKISDILITDYSSVYFDYMLMKKPIIFFPYDLREYLSNSRDMYYKYEDITPGAKVFNIKDLKQELIKFKNEKLYYNEEYQYEYRTILEFMFSDSNELSSFKIHKNLKEQL